MSADLKAFAPQLQQLTPAQRRGLAAVLAGRAYRRYTSSGNSVHCEGVAAAVIWKLEALGLIGEEPAQPHSRVQFGLTVKGSDLLRSMPL